MTKTKIIILITILFIVIIGIWAFSGFYKTTDTSQTETTGTNFFSSLISFGKKIFTPSTETAPANISGFIPETTAEVPAENLVKVSSVPVAGFGVFMKERFVEEPIVVPTGAETATSTTPTPPSTEFAPALRYVDRTTGNIYQTFADKIDERKFTTTIIPEIYDAYFSGKGESVAMRYLNTDGRTIETFLGALPKETLGADTMENTLNGTFLPENISNINISPDTSKLFYLFNIGENDSSIGVVADPLGIKKSQIFNSPFTDWLSWWPNNRMVTLTTKPSANVPGYMYAIDPDKKDFHKILGGINGLTTLTSPSGKLVLYSGNDLSLYVYDVDLKESTYIGMKTLPEKCVWNNNSEYLYCAIPKTIDGVSYPDSWYQGETSFSDEFWQIDVIGGTTSLISDPTSERGERLDGIKLALDENENYLFFINKQDSYLWKIDLNK